MEKNTAIENKIIKNRIRKHKKFDDLKLLWKILFYTVLALFGAACVIPFMLVISASFSTQESIYLYGYSLFPREFTLDGYKILFSWPEQIIDAYIVSTVVTGVGTFINILLCILVAYPISNPEFRYRKSVSFFVFFTMMFGGGLVPYYILVKIWLNMGNTYSVMIVPALVSAGNVFLLRIFMQNVPKDIYESARLDGANEYSILFRITVPLTKSGIAAVTLFIVLAYWNDVITARLFITDRDMRPLALLLDQYSSFVNYAGEQAAALGMVPQNSIPKDAMLFAMCVVATGPMLFVFQFFQKYFVEGMIMGSVKG